jgi:hypothetical protein
LQFKELCAHPAQALDNQHPSKIRANQPERTKREVILFRIILFDFILFEAILFATVVNKIKTKL